MMRRWQRRESPSRLVLDQLQVGVLVLDGAGELVLVNPAARRMGLVVTRGEHDEIANAAIRTLVKRVRRGGGARVLELDLPPVRGVGRREPFGINVRVAALGDGHVAVEASDVTEAHRVSRVRRDFVANVSHELKTPVGALRLLAEALIEATSTAATAQVAEALVEATSMAATAQASTVDADLAAVRRFAERIQHESTRLGRLVGDLLELTRLQAAEPLPEPERVIVDVILAEVIDRGRIAATAKKIDIVIAGTRDLVVRGNERQLVTAVTNLVENAVAYSAEGTTVTITTSSAGCADVRGAAEAADVRGGAGVADLHGGVGVGDVYGGGEAAAAGVDGADDMLVRAGDMLVGIAVADQGIGIERRDLDRIFERFYRADRARSRATGGTGLGLAIVKHIATNHAGWVEVVSTPGSGSTFTLWLPAYPTTTGPPAMTAAAM